MRDGHFAGAPLAVAVPERLQQPGFRALPAAPRARPFLI